MERNQILKHSCWNTGIFRNRPSLTLRNCLFSPDHYKHQQGHNFYCSSEKFSAAQALRALFGSWGREITVSGWQQTAYTRDWQMLEATKKYLLMLRCLSRFVEQLKQRRVHWFGERRKGNEIGWINHLSVTNSHRPCYSTTATNYAYCKAGGNKKMHTFCKCFIISQWF